MTTNPEKGRTGKRKKIHAGHTRNEPTRNKSCMLRGLRHSIETFKVLQGYSEKRTVQWTYERSRASGRDKQGNTVKLMSISE